MGGKNPQDIDYGPTFKKMKLRITVLNESESIIAS